MANEWNGFRSGLGIVVHLSKLDFNFPAPHLQPIHGVLGQGGILNRVKVGESKPTEATIPLLISVSFGRPSKWGPIRSFFKKEACPPP